MPCRLQLHAGAAHLTWVQEPADQHAFAAAAGTNKVHMRIRSASYVTDRARRAILMFQGEFRMCWACSCR